MTPAALGGASPAAAAAVSSVALVGLPGTGKTAVGRVLAARLGRRLADIDAAIEAAAGRSVADVFATEGEDGFRRRELAALEAVLADPRPAVIACGGGLLTDPRARSLVLGAALVVWLDGPDELLLRRLGPAPGRPLLRDDPAGALRRLRAERTPVYACAHLRVDVGDADVEDVCDRVEDAVAGARVLPAAAAGPGGAHGPGPASPAAVIDVGLGPRGYPVEVGGGVSGRVAAHLPPDCRRVAVVADRATLRLARSVLGSVRASGRQGSIVALRGGERLKTWGRAGRLVDRLGRLGLERGDCVVAVGGGTVGDITGFAASVYLRGVALVQVPTTLLAMVDSAVGGKTGVNMARGKNVAGTFWQPVAVLCDLEAVRSLPRRAYLAALAEVVKYTMIMPAARLVEILDNDLGAVLERDPEVLTGVVAECCALKARVVAADERESAGRALLNYGHTVGHALEAVSGYETLLHGEAVALGMRVAGRLSVAAAGCPAEDVAWQDAILARSSLGRGAPAIDVEAVLARIRGDKKARGGRARWVLLHRRGEASPGHELDDPSVRAALGEVLGR